MLVALGTPPSLSGELQRKLVWEDQVYSDIIQQDFANSFYNLTLKLLLKSNWANTFCLHGKFFMTASVTYLFTCKILLNTIKG
jgi:hypothetical protein